MTYLIPDDWFANHGMAPGNARGPQPVLQPRPGNIVTSPIMRGYYGRPPIAMLKTRSVALRPFMDTDVMWGVNGLGSEADINATLARLKKEMKDLALKQAAASTAIAIGLNVIPVLGQAASVIYAAVQTVVGVQNQKELKEVIADTNNKAKRIVAEYELKTEAAQNAVFDQEMAAGTSIAMACQGISGLGDFWSDARDKAVSTLKPKKVVKKLVLVPIAPLLIAKEIGRNSSTVQRVLKPVDKVEKATEKGLDILSGEQAVIEARKTRDKVLAKVRADMEAQYGAAVANMNSAEFRAELRKTIATGIIADPAVAQLVRSRCGLDAGQSLPGASVIASMPSGVKGGVYAAAGVTAAIVAFMAIGGGH